MFKKNCYPYINPYCSVCSFTSQFIWFDDDSVYTVSVKSLLQFIYFCIFRSMIHLNPSVCNMTIACLVNRFHVNEFKLRLYNVHDQNPDLWRNKVRSRLEGCRFSFPLLSHVRLKTFYFNINVYFVFQFKFQWTNKKFLVSEARKGREMLNLHQFYIFPTISIKICCVHNFYWQNESQINQLKFKFVLVQIYVFSNFEKLRLFNSLKII